MGTTLLTVDFLLKHYVEDKKSTVEISKLANCYPEQIRRALKKHNIPVRSKSKASRNFYKQGGENSRKGYEFTEQEKEKASITAKEYWLSEDSTDAKERISESSKIMWEGKTDEEKQKTVSRLHAACRLASQNGSKAELKVVEILTEKYGYHVLRGVTQLAGIGELEVDIALPREGIIIEIDGACSRTGCSQERHYDRRRLVCNPCEARMRALQYRVMSYGMQKVK